MTRRTLTRIVIGVVVFLASYVLLGILLVLAEAVAWLDLYKGLVNLVVAVPAAVLAAAFQRRTSYLSELRNLWRLLIPAAQEAIQYTHLQQPTQEQFARVQAHLSTSIDALRGVFKNVSGPGSGGGLYPYENLKDIHKIISWLGFGSNFRQGQAATARRCIVLLWQEMHAALLPEFDREAPILPVSKFFHSGRSIADDLLSGAASEACLRACEKRQRLPSQGCAGGVQPQDAA